LEFHRPRCSRIDQQRFDALDIRRATEEGNFSSSLRAERAKVTE